MKRLKTYGSFWKLFGNWFGWIKGRCCLWRHYPTSGRTDGCLQFIQFLCWIERRNHCNTLAVHGGRKHRRLDWLIMVRTNGPFLMQEKRNWWIHLTLLFFCWGVCSHMVVRVILWQILLVGLSQLLHNHHPNKRVLSKGSLPFWNSSVLCEHFKWTTCVCIIMMVTCITSLYVIAHFHNY